MAIEQTVIEAVRVMDADGTWRRLPWKSGTRYLIRDDQPFLDVLVRGPQLRSKLGRETDEAKLTVADERPEDGAIWQRWDLESYLARHRRFGEFDIELSVPKSGKLHCYVIPTALLDFRDVIVMIEDIESELDLPAAWDLVSERPERSWSRSTKRHGSISAPALIRLLEEEIAGARSIRRDPFVELGPRSRDETPLAENAIVSHWAARRCAQIRDSVAICQRELAMLQSRGDRGHPEKRKARIDGNAEEVKRIKQRLEELTSVIARLGNDDAELATLVYPTPLFHRDFRLRLLQRAFAPLYSEAVSETEAARSTYPPILLTRLWELWGAVWLVKEFRDMGFTGRCITDRQLSTTACSWRLQRDGMVVELDFEAEPTLVDYTRLPPPHERSLPALEWAALNQNIDLERPYVALEEKCSPDYILRITNGEERFLIVADATLASAAHQKENDSKPKTVEKYRRTLGWSIDGEIVRCHPMGGFVVCPPPSDGWKRFETMIGSSDCTLLCPSPQNPTEARGRLKNLLKAISARLVDSSTPAGTSQ